MTDKECIHCGEHIHADSLEALAYQYGEHIFVKHGIPDTYASDTTRSLERRYHNLRKQNEDYLRLLAEARILLIRVREIIPSANVFVGDDEIEDTLKAIDKWLENR